MSYAVMMIWFPNEGSVPAYELEGRFATKEAALAAASRELAARSYEPGLGFQLFDAEGRLVLAVPWGA